VAPKHRKRRSPPAGTFAFALKKAREALQPKTSQVTLAHRMGVDPMTVSRWERGADPGKHLWTRIVAIFPDLAEFAPAGALAPIGPVAAPTSDPAAA